MKSTQLPTGFVNRAALIFCTEPYSADEPCDTCYGKALAIVSLTLTESVLHVHRAVQSVADAGENYRDISRTAKRREDRATWLSSALAIKKAVEIFEEEYAKNADGSLPTEEE